jgi:hypothetical protein
MTNSDHPVTECFALEAVFYCPWRFSVAMWVSGFARRGSQRFSLTNNVTLTISTAADWGVRSGGLLATTSCKVYKYPFGGVGT